MKKTISLKNEYINLKKELIYTAYAELCESIQTLFVLNENQDIKYKLAKMQIYYDGYDQQVALIFKFIPPQGNAYNVNLTKLSFENCVKEGKLDSITYELLKDIHKALMSDTDINQILISNLAHNNTHEILITKQDMDEKIKLLMGNDYPRYEKEQLDNFLQNKANQANSKKLKV